MFGLTRRAWLMSVAAALAAGCGSDSGTQPKTTLSEQEKQQLKDLDQQRQDEWGTAGKKKK